MTEKWSFQRGVLTGDFLPKLMPHHRQGTLDGACGFYSISMILDYFDICDPYKDVADRRTRIAHFLASLQATPLLVKGLTEKQVRTTLSYFPSAELKIERFPSGSFQIIKGVVKKLTPRAIPGLLYYQVGNGPGRYGHYAVTVGTGEQSIFVMDPSLDAEAGSLFNDYLRPRHRNIVQDREGRRITRLGPLMAIYPSKFEADDSFWLPRE